MSSPKLSRRQFLKSCAFGGAGILVASYPFFIERYLIQVNTYQVPVPNLPLAFEGFTLVQLTDLHFGLLVPEAVIKWVVNKANQLEKDVIVCTGDYVHERQSHAQIDVVWPLMAELTAPLGVFSVLGNHDHWADYDRSMEWMERTGQNLHHKYVSFQREGQRLWLYGAGDYWEDNSGIDHNLNDLPWSECRVVLAHNPDSADIDFTERVDLMISGHTHGGQVSIPFVGAPILPVSNPRYSSGYIETEKTNLFISRGIGWTNFPIRFNCPPEIAVLKLRRKI